MTEPRTTPPPIRYAELARRVADGPVRLSDLVPGDGPLEIEIGFGRGMFLLERARAAPGARVVGIEIKTKWAHLVEQRRLREGLSNAVALAGDAREILSRSMDVSRVSRFFVNFPDPWWKKRHAKRRVLSTELLADVHRLLIAGGELYVATDVEDRATAVVVELTAHPGFALDGERGLVDGNPYGARSNRERRAIEDGLPVYRILARKRG